MKVLLKVTAVLVWNPWKCVHMYLRGKKLQEYFFQAWASIVSVIPVELNLKECIEDQTSSHTTNKTRESLIVRKDGMPKHFIFYNWESDQHKPLLRLYSVGIEIICGLLILTSSL